MPIVLSPLFWTLFRYVLFAGLVAAASRQAGLGARDQRVEDALDDLDDGLALRRDADTTRLTGRTRRRIRIPGGPGVEVDLAGFGRLRLRRI